MRVRILSGNQAGEIQEVDEVQGEHMIQFGYAERALAPAELGAEPDAPRPHIESEPGAAGTVEAP
jgi:hypothetical protein